MAATRQPEVVIKESVRTLLHAFGSHCSVGLTLDILEWMKKTVLQSSRVMYQTSHFLEHMPEFPLCPRVAASYDFDTGEQSEVDELPADSLWHDILIDRLFQPPNVPDEPVRQNDTPSD